MKQFWQIPESLIASSLSTVFVIVSVGASGNLLGKLGEIVKFKTCQLFEKSLFQSSS
jgi:hypothetical protein